MAIYKGEGIGYVHDLTSWSIYEVHTGGRSILEISIDNDDPELIIYVGRPGARKADITDSVIEQEMVGLPVKTNGRAKKYEHEVGGTPESPGDLKVHIDGITVYRYILPRIVRFLADIYIPKPVTEG